MHQTTVETNAALLEPEVAEQDAVTALLVDDNTLFRQGLRMLLGSHGVSVIGEAPNGRDAVRLAVELQPDVVVMDTDMPVMDGIEATSRICSAPGGPTVLVLAAAVSAALDALLAGASGMLLKSAAPEEIAAGVKLAAAGQSVLAPSVAGTLVVRMRELEQARRERTPRRPEAELTAREHDVLLLLAAGHDNVEIGDDLEISPGTVKHHVASVLEKLGVENRVQAAVEAVRLGLV